MKKTTIEKVKLFQEIFAEKSDVKLNQDEVKLVLKAFEEVLGIIGEGLEVGESDYFGCVEVSKHKTAARSGENNFKKGEFWTKPACVGLKLKAKKTFTKSHEKELV